MTKAPLEDTTHHPSTSKKKELAVLLELWRDSKRDPLEFSQRIVNLSFKDYNTEETTP